MMLMHSFGAVPKVFQKFLSGFGFVLILGTAIFQNLVFFIVSQ